MRFYETAELNEPQKQWLKQQGYYFYFLRDGDKNEYIIEDGYVFVNNIGIIITDSPLPMINGSLSSIEFKKLNPGNIPYSELEYIFNEYKNTNFHFRIKGKGTDRYWMCRTYDIAIAKEKLKDFMKIVHEKDSSARAYQFGMGKNPNSFWNTYSKITNQY